MFAGVSRFDSTVTIGPEAVISNDRGDPDAISLGAFCGLFGALRVFPQGGRIQVGEKCFIGSGARIWSCASVRLGDYVLIAHDVNIHDNISHSLSWRERRQEVDNILPHWTPRDHPFDLQGKPIVIEDDAWIGYGASIMGGVRIGRGAIVGAGAVITDDVPDFTVVVGNPMRIVRVLEERDRAGAAQA